MRPCRIRDKIDKILKSDVVLSSLVAMNAALQDNRFDVRSPAAVPCLANQSPARQVSHPASVATL